jgi:hypothetical protein
MTSNQGEFSFLIAFQIVLGNIINLYIFYRNKKKYEWTKFRAISKLDKKFDETMTEYYRAFTAMCKRVCGIKPTLEEGKIEAYLLR